MGKRRTLMRVSAAAAAILTVIFGSGEVAFAASSNAVAYTGGSRAAEVWFNRGASSHGGSAWFDLYDAKCDGYPVYVEYTIMVNGIAGSEKTFTNDGGCHNTWGMNLGSGNFAITYRVCVNDSYIPFQDTCSGRKTDVNS